MSATWHACAECGVNGTWQTRCRSCACRRNGAKKPRTACHPHERTRRDTRLLILQGKIRPARACQRCLLVRPILGEKPLEIHHTDYADPTAVRFLCRPCHRIENAEKRQRAVRRDLAHLPIRPGELR